MTLPPYALPASLAAALGLTALAELCTPLPSPQLPRPVRISPAAAAADTGHLAAAAAWTAVILGRPLFRPDRQPLAPDAAVTIPLPRLSAIVITAAGSAAIFSGDDGKAVSVAAGGMIYGYRVTAIGPGEVNIIGHGDSETLHPQFSPATPSGTAAPTFTAPQRSLDNY